MVNEFDPFGNVSKLNTLEQNILVRPVDAHRPPASSSRRSITSVRFGGEAVMKSEKVKKRVLERGMGTDGRREARVVDYVLIRARRRESDEVLQNGTIERER